ncbi:hypothetical protein RFI_40328 [Reticulomyxa filosa]|uniref:Uncharacterized protein n=1 Tax=Reticulomyxa filosa TaxID=46433 RepID=X6L7D5_RETFI|nr:hypothetical protein RFI_40328 [Reticulomyxa filosa]|eukprot:ETN97203.1 hypothetical protein RFI_40328 [Reticulomyxa filosa]
MRKIWKINWGKIDFEKFLFKKIEENKKMKEKNVKNKKNKKKRKKKKERKKKSHIMLALFERKKNNQLAEKLLKQEECSEYVKKKEIKMISSLIGLSIQKLLNRYNNDNDPAIDDPPIKNIQSKQSHNLRQWKQQALSNTLGEVIVIKQDLSFLKQFFYIGKQSSITTIQPIPEVETTATTKEKKAKTALDNECRKKKLI